jgi:hypothetical protein
MQNENQTATENNVSITEDLTLNETAATQVKGGPSASNNTNYFTNDYSLTVGNNLRPIGFVIQNSSTV